tara:strand:- start:79 stop:633 length:555 start_codon:yes stop_codon:yes gene_type:complete
MSWVRSISGLGWLSGSRGSDSVPSRVTSGTAGLISSGGFVSVSADVGIWKGVSLKSKLNVLSMGWIRSIHGLSWLSGSGRGNSVPGGVSSGGASLICGSGLVGVSANVGIWESISLLEKLKMLGVSWVWGSHSISWLSSSGRGNSVPGGVSGSGASLVSSSGLVGISADVGIWKSVSSTSLLNA